MSDQRPTLAIISQTLRRDLEDPLKYFTRCKLVHLYVDAGYGDMRPEDFASAPVKYATPEDLERELKRIKPDIIQAQEPYASRLALKNAWVVERYARATNTPYFFPVFENRPPHIKFGWFVAPFVQWVVGRFGRNAAGVVTLNDGAKRNLLAAGVPSEKLTRLNWGTWGIDTKEFAPAPRRRSTRPLLFFVGRVAASKGVPEILQAWPKILAAVPTARLVIAGPGSDETLRAAIATSPATEGLGAIKNAELARYFQEAWVTAAPSVTTKIWEEQVGMVNLQSLSCGTPVVTTRSGAIPEYVKEGHGAALVPEHDAEAIATAVIRWFTTPTELKRASEAGRAYILKHYEVKANVERDEDYVLKLLRAHARGKR